MPIDVDAAFYLPQAPAIHAASSSGINAVSRATHPHHRPSLSPDRARRATHRTATSGPWDARATDLC